MSKYRKLKRKPHRANRMLQLDVLEPRHMLAVVEVFAAGQTNQETIQLLIDSTTVATWSNIGGNALGNQFVTFTHTTSGTLTPDRVRVAFTNDAYDPANGIDRNVRIDAIAIDGLRFETESPSVYSTGTWRPDDGITPGFRQSEYLHSNGYFQFSTQSSGTGSLVEVRARGDQGGERGELRVNGATVLVFAATTSFASYSYRAAATVTPNQVQVFFTNDAYDPANGIDRNLIIDFIDIDGARFETEAPNVYSTGTWRAEDGLTAGYRQSDTLHSNGYFAYGQAPGSFSLTLNELSVNENQGQLNFVVFRTGGSNGPVQVDYATATGTATTADFSPVTGTLQFADGITSLAVIINITDDSLVEAAEQFTLSIFNPRGGAALGAITTQIVTIVDNDQVAQGFVYSEGFEGTAQWTRNPNSTDTVTAGFWETGSPEQTTSGGTIQFGSGRNSPRALVTGLAAGGSAGAYDVDGGVTSAQSPSISLPNSADIELRFFYNFAHTSNASTQDSFRVSVVAGGTTQQVFSQSGASSNRYANWQEVKLNLSQYAGQTIRLLVQATDAGTSSTIEAAIDDVVIEVFPNLPGTLSIASTSVNIDESAGAASVTVSRTQGRKGVVSVGYRTVVGTASSADFSATQGTLTFASGELSKTISIPIVNDTLQEQLESFQLEILNPGGGAILGASRTSAITIVDNDNATQDYLPDLVPVAATMLERLSIDTRQIPGRKLMRFSTEAANIGKGPVEIWGGSSSGSSQQVFQRVYQIGNVSRDRLAGDFVYHAEHGHIHLEGFASYHLRTTTTDERIVASGGKTSFCLLNVRQPYPSATANAGRVAGRGGSSCGQTQGISVGYSDVYEANLEGQWIDITGIANGNYWLEMVVNPSGNIQELNSTNNVARVRVTIQNGTVSAGTLADGAPTGNQAKTYTTTGQGTVVALIDSGVDLNNSAFSNRLWRNTGEVAGDGIDNDGNGFVDDVNGFDFVDHDAFVMDNFGHGTFVAGLLGSNIGIAGDAKLMILRATNQLGQGTDEAIAASIRYAVNNGAQIIGLPLQSGGSHEIFEAVAYAQSRNVLLVAAAGNDGAGTPSYIASLSSQFSNVLSAGGMTSDGSKLPESNAVGRSGAVQIDAQGIAMSTVLGNRFATYRGTSVATGFVTGAAALALAANRGLSASQLRDALISSVDLVGPLSDSRGTLDIQGAIDTAAQSAAVTVVQTGTQVAFNLTAADDDVRAFDGGIEIAGIRYPIPVEARTVIIRGRGGKDRLQLVGTKSVDDASIGNGVASLRNAQRNWSATGFEFVNFDGAAGSDTVTIRGGTGNEVVSAKPDGVLMTGVGYGYKATGFEISKVISGGGNDQITIHGSADSDTLNSTPSETSLSNSVFSLIARDFAKITVFGGGGVDRAIITGSSGSDRFAFSPTKMTLTSSLHQIELRDIAISQIFGGGGSDMATLLDDGSNDRLTLALNRVELKTSRHQVTVENFSQVVAQSILDNGRDTIRRLHQSLGFVFKKLGDWIEV